MIGAHDPLAAKIAVRLPAEYRTAVPAGVVEGPQPMIPVTCDDDALVTDFHNLIVTDRRQPVRPTYQQPLSVPDLPELTFVVITVVIEDAR